MVSARVGIILSYPTANPPQKVRLIWNQFNEFVWMVDTVVFAYDRVSKTTLTRLGNNNVFEWDNPGRPASPPLEEVAAIFPPPRELPVPLFSLATLILLPAVLVTMNVFGATQRPQRIVLFALLLAAVVGWPLLRWHVPHPFAPPFRISDDKATTLFASLHHNMYRAFEFQREDDIYDALETSVHGDLLRDVYLQIRQALKMQEQGGAISRIRQVTILTGRNEPTPHAGENEKRDERGFTHRCRWNVSGTVEHWGHIHERTNQYEALFVVEPVADAWKITDVELLDEQRVRFETRLRGL